jgi:hypothetical protein
MDNRLITPFSALLAGPSSSGKSTFIKRFIQHVDAITDRKFTEIVYCYSEQQPMYETIVDKRVRFHEGIIPSTEFDRQKGPYLLVLDDLLSSINSEVVDYFIKGGHHRDISIFLLTQNLFSKAKGHRDISINSHYIILMKSARDISQVNYMARQMAPNDSKHVIESYMDATSKSYGYLLFDFRSTTDDCFRLRTNLFPDDGGQIVYISKKTPIKPELLLKV